MQQNSFALITGASKGIGRSIANELAARGKNVILVSRNEMDLLQACHEIEKKYAVSAKYFSLDLSEDNAPARLLDWCMKNDYAIDILVNNAGYGLSGAFDSHELSRHLNMIHLNMDTVVQLTYLFLPHLKKQASSYILNIASSAGYQATPNLSLYSASKSFVILFSRGLYHELKKTNVSVTCVSPGATDTAFNDRAEVGQKARDLAKKVQMKPEAVARTAVDAMYRKKSEVVIGFLNKLGVFMVWLLPKKFIEKTAFKIYQ